MGINIKIFLFVAAIFFGVTSIPLSAQRLKSKSQDFKGVAESRNLEHDGEHGHEVHCSRERSKAAWDIIEEYLMPFVERENYEISTSCRLHRDNDLYRDQEEHKVYVELNEWRCGYCKKTFTSEKFLDHHLNNRHNNLLNTNNSKCLADLCGALHCDVFMNAKLPAKKCNPSAAARNRHLCESLADSCFPVNRGASANRLHELFIHQFCGAHTCSGNKKPFARGGRKEPNIFYLAMSILTVMLLPLFYVIVCLHQSEIRKDSQALRRLSKLQRKAKPS